ncbi:MAG: ComEC/Rec2 family competence protein [Anaerolineae bacterium]|nr:ComEC/Rec2 family competence protein [Anaerolineae bacterium]
MTLAYVALAWLLGLFVAHAAWEGGIAGCGRFPLLAWAAAASVLLISALLPRLRPPYRFFSLLSLAFLLGSARYVTAPLNPCFGPHDLAAYNGTAEEPRWLTVTGIVDDFPDVRDRITLLRLRAESVEIRGQVRPVRGLVLVQAPRYPAYRYGDGVRVRGVLETPPDLAGFSYREYLARQGVYSLLRYPTIEVTGQGRGVPWRAVLLRLKEASAETLSRLLPDPYAALAKGMLLGIESGIPDQVDEDFRRTGTTHVIVISGSQVALLAGVVYFLARRACGQRLALYPAATGILLYTILVGGDPPVVRAAIMGLLYMLAQHVGRPTTGIISLSAAALLMTLANPLALWDAGAQLSFAATAGLILVAPRLQRGCSRAFARRLPPGRGLRLLQDSAAFLALTLAAQVTTAPIIAYYFGRLPLISLPANFLILPAQPFILEGGTVALLLRLLGLAPLAQLAAYVPWLALVWTVGIVEALARVPVLDLGRPAAGWVWAAYGALGLWLAWDRVKEPLSRLVATLRPRQGTAMLVAGTVVIAIAAWVSVLQLPDGRLHVRFLDVGEGNATLITTPDGRHVLIDGGPGPKTLSAALGRALPFRDRQLELVVLTRAERGHLDGLVPLAGPYRITQVLQPLGEKETLAYNEWRRRLRVQNIPILRAEPGLRVELGRGAVLDLLGPGGAGDPLTVRVAWGHVSFLFSELDEEGESRLLAGGWPIAGAVLRVPRQGSADASGPRFLAAVNPLLAVISTGKDNPHGHPAAEVLERLEGVGAQVLRTDERGTVEVITDGARLWVRTRQ